jgi:uncharacterized protein
MNFVTMRELRERSGDIWQRIEAGEAFVVTRQGKPFAPLVGTEPTAVRDSLRALWLAALRKQWQTLTTQAGAAAPLGLSGAALDAAMAEEVAAPGALCALCTLKPNHAVLHAVLDTNTLVSALWRPRGPHGPLMAALLRGAFVQVLCGPVIGEYRAVLTRPQLRLRLGPSGVAAALDTLATMGTRVEIDGLPASAGLRVAGDWPFIAAGSVAGCPLVTGNTRHFLAALGGAGHDGGSGWECRRWRCHDDGPGGSPAPLKPHRSTQTARVRSGWHSPGTAVLRSRDQSSG